MNKYNQYEENIYISSIAIQVGDAFGLNRESISKFKAEMLGETKETPITNRLRSQMTQKLEIMDVQHQNEFQSDLILGSIEIAHIEWAKRNADNFLDHEKCEQKEYQFLPYEYLGWDGVKNNLAYITPITDSLGMSINQDALKQAFERQALCNIIITAQMATEDLAPMGSLEDLIKYSVSIYNKTRVFLSDEAIEEIKKNDGLRNKISQQIQDEGLLKESRMREKIDKIITTANQIIESKRDSIDIER